MFNQKYTSYKLLQNNEMMKKKKTGSNLFKLNFLFWNITVFELMIWND